MTRLSGPMMLILAVVGGWAVARATYVGWSNALSEDGTARFLPGLMIPIEALPYRSPDHAQRGLLTTNDARPPTRHPSMIRESHVGHVPVLGGDRDVATGVDSAYVHQQLQLLSDIVNPGRSANSILFHRSTMPVAGLTAVTPSMGPLTVHIDTPRPPGRWSLASWAFYRSDRGANTLGVQPQYGGSQMGARLSYRLDGAGRAAVFARVSATPQGRDSTEGAVGLAVRPVHSVPLSIIVERRSRISGGDGRSAFAAYVVGGVNAAPVAAGFRLDAYGAAGVVGARRRDTFAEGQARLTHDVARAGAIAFSAGAGAWGGAQAGVARADIGPTLVVNFGDVHKERRHVSLDYRHRVAGNGAPGSGIAVTLAADF
ncbi:MAG: hypothetical protein ABL909_00905 [Sphingopyxis sp.]